MMPLIHFQCHLYYGSYYPEITLGRSYSSMVIEWWLHNIGYYLTKPFCSNVKIEAINLRCRDVDLNEYR